LTREIRLPTIGTVAAWREAARALALADVPAEAVVWRVGSGGGDLFATQRPALPDALPGAPNQTLSLPRTAVSGLKTALCHSDPERFARAYGILLRLVAGTLTWGERRDRPMHTLLAQEKAVRRDIHKMHAFVRFRELPAEGPRRRFGAWFEPDHPIVEAASPFFARRFGDMDFTIATPTLTARFMDGALTFTETEDTARPPADATEDLWRAYFVSIFNPARLKPKAMQAEMPKKYWSNLPEAALIKDLVRTAAPRANAMRASLPTEPPRRAAVARQMAARPLPPEVAEDSLPALRRAAEACTRCPLHRDATQTVFGEGPTDAALMLVGEQPGDQEDLAGRPFVGPAGKLLDAALAEAGLNRAALYLTNAVKHFKFAPRGKRRIHQRPEPGEVATCRAWLEGEVARVAPRLLVALGATAAHALTGDGTALLKRRGTIERPGAGAPVLITVHPSYLLRIPDSGRQAEARAMFVADLRLAQEHLLIPIKPPGDAGQRQSARG